MLKRFHVKPHYTSTLQQFEQPFCSHSSVVHNFAKKKIVSLKCWVTTLTSLIAPLCWETRFPPPYSWVCRIQVKPVAHLSDIIFTLEPPQLVVAHRSSHLHVTNPSSWIRLWWFTDATSAHVIRVSMCSCFSIPKYRCQTSKTVRGGNYGMVVVAVCLELLLHGAWRLHVVAIFLYVVAYFPDLGTVGNNDCCCRSNDVGNFFFLFHICPLLLSPPLIPPILFLPLLSPCPFCRILI